MSDNRWLVAGLGNPGSKYEKNRHNIGFMAIDMLSEQLKIDVDKSKFKGLYGKGRFNGNEIFLLKPYSFMNCSGGPLFSLSRYFNISPSNIILIHDDLDMPPGKIRIREKGGAGGHNGIKSIVQQFGTNAIGRVKIGIGRPLKSGQVTSYVLSDFDHGEMDVIESGIEKTAEAVQEIILNGYTVAMNRFNK